MTETIRLTVAQAAATGSTRRPATRTSRPSAVNAATSREECHEDH